MHLVRPCKNPLLCRTFAAMISTEQINNIAGRLEALRGYL